MMAEGDGLMTLPIAPSFFARYWPVLSLLLGLASVLWPLLGLPAAFASFMGIVALRRPPEAQLPLARWWLIIGALCSSVGVVRFLVIDAMPGIVGGGRSAVEQQAVSRLRDVLFAEDAMRRAAWIDPDRDGIGSAASLEELCGGPPLRGQAPRPTPVLHCGELAPSALGPAARSGAYLYTLCLPTPGGGWSAASGTPVDEETAERRFVAFAWPENPGPFTTAFSIDEHENIREAALPAAGSVEGARRFAASCAEALQELPWQVWKNKKPRPELPGDSARGSADSPREGGDGVRKPGDAPRKGVAVP
jgi:hypothetical protein